MSSTFISLVGYQPSAVATGLASWINAYPNSISRVVLLTTEGVERDQVVVRLKEWMASTYRIQEIEAIPICNGLIAEGNRLPPAEAIQQWMERNSDSAKQIVFNAKPGLNAHVVTLAQALSEKALFLYPMVGKISTWEIRGGEEHWGEILPANLGLKALLKLYGVRFRITGQCSSLITQLVGVAPPGQVAQGLELTYAKVQLDLAFEKGGFLYVLKVIDYQKQKTTADGQRTEMADNKKNRQQVRELQRIHNQEELNKLQPQVAVLTPHQPVLDRAKEAKFLRINSKSNGGRDRLLKWMKGNVPGPGHQEGTRKKVKRSNQTPVPSVSKRVSGAGGSGPPLAVCLGNDPSSTLVSLCTHKPKQAWVFYDPDTPTVDDAARRLSDNISRFPVGQVEFIKTDMLGRGIVPALNAKQATLSEQIRVDISPGTKEQGQALARIANAEIWSLVGHTGEATCISHPNVKKLSLEAPDILTQAVCVEGDLGDEGKEPLEQGGFFHLLARFWERYLIEKRDKGERYRGGFSLQNLDCQSGHLRVDGECVTVKLNHETQVAALDHTTQQGGNWFEPLVANAFRSAGADEVRWGMKWTWPPGSPFSNPKDEVDVLARFKHRFVAVSCKMGSDTTTAKAKREIEATAKLLGRMCIPILAQPLAADDEIQKNRNAQEEATILDLRDLTRPNELASTLETIFRRRSTVN